MLHQPQNIRRTVHHKSSHTASPAQSHTKSNQKDSDPKGKSKDAPIKVILSLFGLLVVVFIMFSVFQPKKNRPPDRPPLKVYRPPGYKANNPNVVGTNNDRPHRLININQDNKDAEEESDNSPDIALDNPNPFNHEYNSDKINKRDSADIEFIDSGNPKEADFEKEILDDETEFQDLYAKESIPPRPPKSIYIDNLSEDDIEDFWSDDMNENDIFDSTNLPAVDSNGHIYIMNYIFLPYEQMLSIFLLTSEYLNPDHGLHSWPSKRRRQDLPILYKNIRDTIYPDYKQVKPTFACVFRVNNNIWISKVDFVPNNTTRDRYVNYGTEILRCNVPMGEINKVFDKDDSPFYDEEYTFEFVLTQKWKELIVDSDERNRDDDELDGHDSLVHVSLSFEMGMRSGIKLLGYDDKFMYRKANQNRYLTVCMPPISEPMAYLGETISHYISNIGIEHIYIATFFQWNLVEEYRERLIEKLQPWYDRGLISIWPHEQPWIGFTDKAKSHWLNQCLYYVKSRDSYTLSLDVDEFLVLNTIDKVYEKYNQDKLKEDATSLDEEQFEERAKLMQSQLKSLVKKKVDEFDDNHWCWLTFQSYQMWKLNFANETFMIRRFIGREQKAQLTWSKVIWNNKHLHYTGYHAGGSCSAQGHDWTNIVYDWRERKDPKYVYRFDPDMEGGLLHYYNCRQIRIEPRDGKLRNPWTKLVNDTRMRGIYWDNINKEFETNKLKNSYPDHISDVMKTRYYKQHYGQNNNMAVWHENFNT